MIDLVSFVDSNTDWGFDENSNVYEVRSEEEGVGNALWVVAGKGTSLERSFFSLWYAAQDYAEGTDSLSISRDFKAEIAQCNAVDSTPEVFNGKAKSIVDSIYSKTKPLEVTSLIDDHTVKRLLSVPLAAKGDLVYLMYDVKGSYLAFLCGDKECVLLSWEDVA